MASGTIGVLRQKAGNSLATKAQKRVSSNGNKKRQANKAGGAFSRYHKRQQKYDGDATSDDEDSEEIEYDDSDNNANVAGADEADSAGEVEDTVGETQDFQEVHQVIFI